LTDIAGVLIPPPQETQPQPAQAGFFTPEGMPQ